MIRGDLVGTVHELKIEKRFFDDILSGLKRFELRRNDRNFCVGDTVILKEVLKGEFTGRLLKVHIVYLLKYADFFVPIGLEPGYCIWGFELVADVCDT